MVVFSDPLDTYGWGGGRGPDGDPYQGTPDDFKHNVTRLSRDLAEGSNFVNRMSCTQQYTRTGVGGHAPDTWYGGWNFTSIDRAVAIADQYGGNIILTINPASPSANDPAAQDKVPKITGTGTAGTMLSWKLKIKEVFDRYAGPSATIKAGSVVRMQDGSDYTISADWPGIKFFECWNEPNQIGSAGGVLAQGGSNQGRPWYDLVFIINRDFAAVAQAHPAWGTFEICGVTMGGLEPDFLAAGNGRPFGVLDWGESKGFDWNEYHNISVHCYQNTNPMTAPGGVNYRGRLDTIRTHIRPIMNAHGADQCGITITEAGVGGSLSKGGNTLASAGALTEKWNAQQNYNSITGVGKAKSDVFWGHLHGDAGEDTDQAAGDLSQPLILKNYVIKCHDMNTTANTRIRMLCFHMLIRTAALTACEASNGGASGVVGRVCSGGSNPLEGGASDYLYWQKARCVAELYTADTDPAAYHAATGSPKRSTDWLPGARELHDAILSYSTLAAPNNTAAPSLNNPTPAIGDTLVVDVGVWSGSPAPSFTYQWQRGGVDVAGETGTSYDVTLADLGAVLRAVVTGTNSAGSDTANTPATAAVASPDDSPSNTTTPSLSDAQGPLATSGMGPVNTPDVGVPITVDLGEWTPDPDLYLVRWQRRDPGTLVVTDIDMPLPGAGS